jgi:hypothetical protein
MSDVIVYTYLDEPDQVVITPDNTGLSSSVALWSTLGGLPIDNPDLTDYINALIQAAITAQSTLPYMASVSWNPADTSNPFATFVMTYSLALPNDVVTLFIADDAGYLTNLVTTPHTLTSPEALGGTFSYTFPTGFTNGTRHYKALISRGSINSTAVIGGTFTIDAVIITPPDIIFDQIQASRAYFDFDTDVSGPGAIAVGDFLKLYWWLDGGSQATAASASTAQFTQTDIDNLSSSPISLQTAVLADGHWNATLEHWRGSNHSLAATPVTFIKDSLGPLSVIKSGGSDNFDQTPTMIVSTTAGDAVAGQVINLSFFNGATEVAMPPYTLLEGDISGGNFSVSITPTSNLEFNTWVPKAARNGLKYYAGAPISIIQQTVIGTPSFLSAQLNTAPSVRTFTTDHLGNAITIGAPVNSSRKLKISMVIGGTAGSFSDFRVKVNPGDSFSTLTPISTQSFSVGGFGDFSVASYEMDAPTGSTINTVEVTGGSLFSAIGISIMPVHNSVVSVSGDISGASYPSGTTSPITNPISVPLGGLAVMTILKSPSEAITWTNMTEDGQGDYGGVGTSVSMAHSTATGAVSAQAAFASSSRGVYTTFIIRGG